MKAKIQSSLVVLHCLAAFALGSAVLSGQEALVLDRPQLDGSGNVHLSATVGAFTNVVCEISTNLTSWTPVVRATLASGILELIQPVESQTRFYRLHRQDGGQAPLAVNVSVDALLRVSTVITSDGGEVSVSDATGTRYTLTMPTNAVLEPVIISLTVVSNFSGLPFSDSAPRGILLEPEGLQFSTPGRLTIEYSHQQPSTNTTSFWLSGDGHALGLLPDQLISNRVELAVYHFSTYGVANAIASEIQAQTQQTVPASFDNLEQQFANELRPLRDSGRLPLPGAPPPEPIRSRLEKLLDDFIRSHLNIEFRAELSTCGGAIRGMVEVAQTLALVRAYGLDESGLLPFTSSICEGLAKCAEEDIARCKQGDTAAYEDVVRREANARALGFSCHETPADQFTNCLPKYYGTLKMLLHEKKLASYDSSTVQSLDLCMRHATFNGRAVTVTEGFVFPPLSDLNLSIDFVGAVTISDQRTSLNHHLDGCEASPGGVNCGLGVRDTEESGSLVSNITVTVSISRGLGQVSLTCESVEVWLPLHGYSWVYSNNPCTCKDSVNQHDNLESLLQVTIGGSPIAVPPLEQTKDKLYAEWLKKQFVCDEFVNEAWIMDLKRRPGS